MTKAHFFKAYEPGEVEELSFKGDIIVERDDRKNR